MKNRKHASLRTFSKTCALGGQKCEETRQLSGQPMQNEHQIFPNSFTGKCCLDLTWFPVVLSLLSSPDFDDVDTAFVGVAGAGEGTGTGWEVSGRWPVVSIFFTCFFFRLCWAFSTAVPDKYQECILNAHSRSSDWLSDRVNLKCIAWPALPTVFYNGISRMGRTWVNGKLAWNETAAKRLQEKTNEHLLYASFTAS